jgi:hypothetical protein
LEVAIAGALLSATLPQVAYGMPPTVHLSVHYQRPGDEYTGWNLWLWKKVVGTAGDAVLSSTGVDFNGSD